MRDNNIQLSSNDAVVAVVVGFALFSAAEVLAAEPTGKADVPWYEQRQPEIPSTASRYGVAPGILLAADATDAMPQGTSPMPSSVNKPGNAIPNVKIQLNEIRVTAKRIKDIGPLPGLNLTKEQIPGNIQSITAKDIKDTQSLSITDLLNSKLQSVNVNDYQGNPFQMDLTYRGFTAGPQIGSQQGLSVFFDGIRVNEPFGDVVNWDMIPMNAISGLDVFPGSNPLFGLNTLGGAIAIKTKSGFDSPGVSAQILKGSFGRDQLLASGGWNNGTLAAFGAVSLFMEDGWRDNSPSKVNQAFGKLDWQGERASLTFSTLAAVNKLVGNGTVPIELYKENRGSVFTSPDETRNRLLQFQISGAFEVSDTFNITGMVYNRQSKRISSTGDMIDIDTFRELGNASRRALPGEHITCAYLDANGDGLPNYYLDELTYDASTGKYTSAFIEDVKAHNQEIAAKTYLPDYDALIGPANSGTVPADFIQRITTAISARDDFTYTDVNGQEYGFVSNGFFQSPDNVALSAADSFGGYQDAFFTKKNADGSFTRYNIYAAPALDTGCYDKIRGDSDTKLYALDENGDRVGPRDGALYQGASGTAGTGTGYIPGTPTAVITNSMIDQNGLGGGLQFNWNLDNHKFMIGTSIDRADAKYNATQRFGLMDDSRNVYSDPANIGEEYYAASHDVIVNDFDGTKTTSSIYFSETWTPTQTLNISLSGRYNDTFVRNTLAPRRRAYELTDVNLLNRWLDYIVCPGTDVSGCQYDPTKMVSIEDYMRIMGRDYDPLSPAVTEKFDFHSLNPAFGATWQTTPRLNMYFNWNQGTRTPSVIELGCAYDSTPAVYRDNNGVPIRDAQGNYTYGPATLVDGRACNLPSVMSGDPYLPQVMAQTYEFGVRGKFKDLMEWNVTAYRTMLRDDIYMVSATQQLSYFQSIGDTRRQGLEFGLQGGYGKHEFRVNYSLTEATFQSLFKMLSPNNSNTITNDTRNADYNTIQVEPSDRMPGVPLNNINLSWMYKMTPAFKVGFTMVAHGDAFVRGNENNEHTPGPSRGVIMGVQDENGATVYTKIPGPDYRYSGKTAGYAVLNLRATYDIGKGWTAGMLVNNLLDKEYVTAGRLGLTPFAPSTYGAIGAGGFNYNSSEWLSTQLISAGAPRGVWFTLGYDFDASKKSQLPKPSSTMVPEPDRTLEPAKPKTPEEIALAQALDVTRPLPVLKRDLAQSASALKSAEQQVSAAIEQWRQSIVSGDTEAYLKSYAAMYAPDGMSRQSWEEQRKMQLSIAAGNAMVVDHLVIAPQGRGMATVFAQAEHGQPAVRKLLGWEQQNGQWVIVREYELKTPVKATMTSAATSRENNANPQRNIRIISLNKEVK
ncbi:TonB-dependent receptor [Methylovorus sp. MM2]|uniref:TonB-dependent receptor domain-containing protein n=1 Tax=Methylovorus sp. MM2 TaxID=1848038 RepID=UPI0007DFE9F4|nr:TonB-dependent receptor [Methylovorus sp. MM2]OAM51157.1 TonB-dependent receptor [Methylovorus sp. MM2]